MKLQKTDYDILDAALDDVSNVVQSIRFILHRTLKDPIRCSISIRLQHQYAPDDVAELADELLSASRIAAAINNAHCYIVKDVSLRYDMTEEIYDQCENESAKLCDIILSCIESRTTRTFTDWLRERNCH